MSTRYLPASVSTKQYEEQIELNDSMNFDDNYNEQEYLKKQYNGEKQNTQPEKLSIMGDFNQLCKKLHIPSNQEQDIGTSGKDDFLGQYYAKLKHNNQILDNTTLIETKKQNNIQFKQIQHMRSSSQNFMTPKVPILPLQKSHERNPSHEQFFKKPQSNILTNSLNKRTYSSVQGSDKYKIPLQPSNQGHLNLKSKTNEQKLNIYRSDNTSKDYYGQNLENFVSKKVHGKNFISNPKQKQNPFLSIKPQFKEEKLSKNYFSDLNNQNSLKVSNLLQKFQGPISQEVERPTILIYKRVIDLTVQTQKLRQQIQRYKIRSEYNMVREQGLFGKAISHQRQAKTGYKVKEERQSNNYNINNENQGYEGFYKGYR